MTRFFTQFDSPLCPVTLVGKDSGITHLHLHTKGGKRRVAIDPEWIRSDARFASARIQILEYMEGKRTAFDLVLSPEGTPFQQTVWQALCEIPFGELRSYGEIARRIGKPTASRAVGAANGKNPLPLLIPCHRVVGANGKLTGFAHGLAIKERLISLESGKPLHFRADPIP